MTRKNFSKGPKYSKALLDNFCKSTTHFHLLFCVVSWYLFVWGNECFLLRNLFLVVLVVNDCLQGVPCKRFPQLKSAFSCASFHVFFFFWHLASRLPGSHPLLTACRTATEGLPVPCGRPMLGQIDKCVRQAQSSTSVNWILQLNNS